jgi:hypothetical protein
VQLFRTHDVAMHVLQSSFKRLAAEDPEAAKNLRAQFNFLVLECNL